LASSPVTRVVVAPFLFDNNVTGLSQSLQENLITALLRKGMAVVERSQLEQVLKEQKLGYSGLVKLDSAKKLGQLLGADAMVLGSLRDFGDTVDVNARLVALESGTGLSGAQARIAKTPVVAQLLTQVLDTNAVSMVGGSTGTTGKPVGKEPMYPVWEDDEIKVEALSQTGEYGSRGGNEIH
jgi:curli biogenesis system outer membrane secretion channel CsgG